MPKDIFLSDPYIKCQFIESVLNYVLVLDTRCISATPVFANLL